MAIEWVYNLQGPGLKVPDACSRDKGTYSPRLQHCRVWSRLERMQWNLRFRGGGPLFVRPPRPHKASGIEGARSLRRTFFSLLGDAHRPRPGRNWCGKSNYNRKREGREEIKWKKEGRLRMEWISYVDKINLCNIGIFEFDFWKLKIDGRSVIYSPWC